MYGLLGRKLGHSLSPQIHSHLCDYEYKLYPMEPECLDSFFNNTALNGFNVTIPYKIEAYNRCDELSETAKKVGSVNTIIRRKDGTLYGDNTDYFGFLYMAEKASHYWFDMLDLDKIDLGTSKLQLVNNGIYIKKYKITVPKELNEYE